MSTPPARSAQVQVQVPFHDLDPAGIVWHGHYAKYFELARCALLESFDYNYPQMAASGYNWPVIDLRVRYVRPAVFAQHLNVSATLVEWQYRLRIRYRITDAATGERLTQGETVQVAVDLETRQMCLPSPTVLLEKLGLAT
ncbi:MAG TPA: acyl-CoA thioesterase [Immundisolibacter sp.]|nr:acyl-CoA thioesterase [Immundisolibacter sp.]